MRYRSSLVRAALLRRYKRFLADVRLESGEEITAHIADPGRLTGLAVPGARLWLSVSDAPSRKYRHSVELIEQRGVLVGVDPSAANAMVAEAIASGALERMIGPTRRVAREARIAGGGRIDFRIERAHAPPLWLEVKSVSWKEGDVLLFPDAPSARAREHLRALEAIVRGGEAAALAFVVQRADGRVLRPSREIDPSFAEALERAARAGVAIFAARARIGLEERGLASDDQNVTVEL